MKTIEQLAQTVSSMCDVTSSPVARAAFDELVQRATRSASVPGPFVLSSSEQGALSLAARGHFDNGTVGALTRSLERAVRTLGPQAGSEWAKEDYAEAASAIEFRDRKYDVHGSARVALDAVQHRLSAPAMEPGPFRLTEEEKAANRADPASLGKHGVRLLQDAIARAVRTLGAQGGGEWAEDDYLTAEAALDHERHRGVKTEKSCHAAKVALDAVKHRLHAPLVLPPAEPQPDAPTDIAALPDYWDARRRRQEKPDLSRCAAELRVALASSPADKLTAEERACVNAKRHVLEDGEEVLVSIIDRLAPDPDPVSPALVDAVCKKMQLTGPVDQSFAQAVLETAHALGKAGAK